MVYINDVPFEAWSGGHPGNCYIAYPLVPEFTSLTSSSPLCTTSGSSPSKIVLNNIKARIISEHYKRELMCRQWSKNNYGLSILFSSCSNIARSYPLALGSLPSSLRTTSPQCLQTRTWYFLCLSMLDGLTMCNGGQPLSPIHQSPIN